MIKYIIERMWVINEKENSSTNNGSYYRNYTMFNLYINKE